MCLIFLFYAMQYKNWENLNYEDGLDILKKMCFVIKSILQDHLKKSLHLSLLYVNGTEKCRETGFFL